METKGRTIAWFMKEVRSITVRNIVPASLSAIASTSSGAVVATTDEAPTAGTPTSSHRKPELYQELPSTFIEVFIPESRKVLSSRVVPDSCNPTWIISGSWTESPTTLSKGEDVTDLVIRIYNQRDAEPSTEGSSEGLGVLLHEQRVPIDKIVPLGPIQLSLFTSLPSNAIFFGSTNSYYVPEALYSLPLFHIQLTQAKVNVEKYSAVGFPTNLVNGDSDIDDEKNKQLEAFLQSATTSLCDLQLEVNSAIDALESPRRNAECNLALSELHQLRLDVEMAEALLREEELNERLEMNALASLSDLRGSMAACQELTNAISALNDEVQEKQIQLMKGQFLLEARQLRLMTELQSIYPIELQENGEYTIRGLELSADLSQKDDDTMSSALGLVVHLLLLASKYLEIPLRYQLWFYASRSMIRDTVNGQGLTLPLFKRGTDRERFERAIMWLRKDIEQLLSNRGVVYDPSRDILFNVNQLFVAELTPPFSI